MQCSDFAKRLITASPYAVMALMRLNKPLPVLATSALAVLGATPVAAAQSVELDSWLSPGSVSSIEGSPFGSLLDDPVASRMEGGVIAELNKERATANKPLLTTDAHASDLARDFLENDFADFLYTTPFESFIRGGFSLDGAKALVCGPSDAFSPASVRASIVDNANALGTIDESRGYFLAAPGYFLDEETTKLGIGYHEEAGRGCLIAVPTDFTPTNT